MADILAYIVLPQPIQLIFLMQRCKFCDILIRRPKDMIAHVGSVHNKVENFLPDKLKINNETQSQDVEDIGGQMEPLTEIVPSQKFQCKICPSNPASSSGYDKVSSLLAHYSLVHYQEELGQFIDKENKVCLICKKKAPKVRLLLAHVVCAHNKLEEHLPEEYHQLQLLVCQ